MSEPSPTLPGVTHHHADLNGTRLHYVAAGTKGSPILLVHGWPETWWAFRHLIPLLAASHRVYAVDLRGFGASSKNADADYSQAAFSEDLHQLVGHLGVGPLHVLCQDISGGLTFDLAVQHPEDVKSFIGVETALIGFGLEALADVNNGGAWHVGFLGAPGIPQLLLPGHERDLITWAYRVMGSTATAVTPADLDEFVNAYTGPDAWNGTSGLYQAIFSDKGRTKALASAHPLRVPVLAVNAPGLQQVAVSEVRTVPIQGIGHLVAQEAPRELADALLAFVGDVDQAR